MQENTETVLKDSKEAMSKILSDRYPAPDASFTDLLKDIDVPENLDSDQLTTHLQKALLVVPARYLSRNGVSVDICGVVEKETEEFSQGFRYFSRSGSFYRKDGRCQENRTSPEDLHTIDIPTDENEQHHSPSVSIPWVHPRHMSLQSFFKKLIPGKPNIKSSRYYLNRMGLTVQVVRESLEGNSPFYYDANSVKYDIDGCVLDTQSSMFDLMYEIRNWDLFSQADWSLENLFHLNSHDNSIPEMFNPFYESDQALWGEMWDLMKQAQSLALKLGANYTFSLSTEV